MKLTLIFLAIALSIQPAIAQESPSCKAGEVLMPLPPLGFVCITADQARKMRIIK